MPIKKSTIIKYMNFQYSIIYTKYYYFLLFYMIFILFYLQHL